MRVFCDVDISEVQKEDGRMAPGVTVTCGRCQHAVSSFGTTDRSVRRCFMLLKEECPNKEANYYLEGSHASPAPTAHAAAAAAASRSAQASGAASPVLAPAASAPQVEAPMLSSIFGSSAATPAPITAAEVRVPRVIQENRIVVLKTATTGLDLDHDEVVQIALVTREHAYAGWCSSVLVAARVPITSGAFDVHRIAQAELQYAPHFEAVAGELLARLSNRVVLGWNILGFDRVILERQFAHPLTQAALANMSVIPPPPAAVLDVRYLATHLSKNVHSVVEAAERWGVIFRHNMTTLEKAAAVWRIFVSILTTSDLCDKSLAELLEIQSATEVLLELKRG